MTRSYVPGRLINLEIPVAQGLRLRIVERPACVLDAGALAQLCADLRTVAHKVLGEGELSYGVFGSDRAALERSVVTVIYDTKTGLPVAFNALAIMGLSLGGRPVDVLHLGLVMVDPALRGRGLSDMLYGLTCVMLFLRGQGRPLRLSNVTQVPAVFGMVAETFNRVFPTASHQRDPCFEHVLLARQIMASHRHVFGVGAEAIFDAGRFVITNAYTGGSDDLKKTFDQAAKHRLVKYNDLCGCELDYGRGDDFLQIGQIDLLAVQRYLSKVVPPKSAPWLAGQVVLFALGAFVIPVLHWLADDRPFGDLRPIEKSPT